MVNDLSEDISLRWKFVDYMTLLDVTRKNMKISPFEILEDFAAEALKNKMHVNPLKSTILTINFLNTPPPLIYIFSFT
jgi:dihydroneopterin aldolase